MSGFSDRENTARSLGAQEAGFSRVYLTRDARGLAAAERGLARLAHIPHHIIDDKSEIPADHLNRETLLVTRARGSMIGRCPGSRGHVCCNYLTVDLYMGCTLGCSYCIMQSYLNFAPVIVNADPWPAIESLRRTARDDPGLIVRAGTGEVGDSLQLDPLFELSRDFITALADLPNVFFECKTKTSHVDHLLPIRPKGNAVIGFSVNPPQIAGTEEGSAAELDERFEAARRAADAGYLLAFHFDPIMRFPGWETAYDEVMDRLREFPTEQVPWISLGTIRYTGALRGSMDDRPYLYDEFVACRDGKYRYIQRVRTSIYARLLEGLRGRGFHKVYLCMESGTIWRRIYGAMPLRIPELFALFKRGGRR